MDFLEPPKEQIMHMTFENENAAYLKKSCSLKTITRKLAMWTRVALINGQRYFPMDKGITISTQGWVFLQK
jgi:hypothetical protein